MDVAQSFAATFVDELVTPLHGFTLTGASWDELVAKMPAGCKWIAPNLRGHGFAPTSPATMDDCAADLVALWNDLGIERSHVVGYSMGGRLALHVAVRLPERTKSEERRVGKECRFRWLLAALQKIVTLML